MEMAHNWSRRGFVGTLIAGAASLFNARNVFGTKVANADSAASLTGFGHSGNPYEELGIPTVINAQGTMTMLGGSLIRPEVEAVMSQAAKHFVGIPALEVAAGKRIAQMLKLPQGV
jgi:L-seryl-tRNA(Ser) seleniumtransferase